jgi:hypothetical protein
MRQVKGGITAVARPDALVLSSDAEIRGKKEDSSSIANFRVGPGAKKSRHYPRFTRTDTFMPYRRAVRSMLLLTPCGYGIAPVMPLPA